MYLICIKQRTLQQVLSNFSHLSFSFPFLSRHLGSTALIILHFTIKITCCLVSSPSLLPFPIHSHTLLAGEMSWSTALIMPHCHAQTVGPLQILTPEPVLHGSLELSQLSWFPQELAYICHTNESIIIAQICIKYSCVHNFFM